MKTERFYLIHVFIDDPGEVGAGFEVAKKGALESPLAQ